MRRQSLYLLCGFGIAVGEYGQLLVEVGRDIERFALGRITGLKDAPPRTIHIPIHLNGRKVAESVVAMADRN